MATATVDTETGEVTTTPPANDAAVLNAKLARVLGTVKRIPKNGFNSFHKFHFATESDVSDAVRDVLASENVGTSVRFELIEVKEWHTPKGKDTLIAFVKCWLELRCGDTGAVVVTEGLGSGDDPLDKAVMKAETAAVKYALMKAFLIPTGDDPDAGSAHQVEEPIATDDERLAANERINVLTEAHQLQIRETMASKGFTWETLTKQQLQAVTGWITACEKASPPAEPDEDEAAAEAAAELDAAAADAAEADGEKPHNPDDDIPF